MSPVGYMATLYGLPTSGKSNTSETKMFELIILVGEPVSCSG